jgi:class 3 adenylate cyclase
MPVLSPLIISSRNTNRKSKLSGSHVRRRHSDEDPDHPVNIIQAGLEIRDWMKKNKKRGELGLDSWELRIGIHVGPAVAGVVGRKKYAYDIWGSTVNIASRMESSGQPGLVNISSAAYELVKHRYNCVYRGKIMAKNIGEIDMYFVDREIA